METITDDYMREMLQKTKAYTVLILKKGANYGTEGSEAIVWEHGRRNFTLREDGRLAIVCPVNDGSDVTGVGIFDLTVEETRAVMEEDPGVQAGLFEYEVHASRGFPGSVLPG
jgi:hypothetical protein